MSKITNKELRDLTIKMMEKTTGHYLNNYESKVSDDINKLIEKDVAMRIVDIVPDRYTEITVDVIDFFGDIEIAAVFKTDSDFKLCVDYKYVVPYDPTSQIENFYFGSKPSRGSKVETLPCGQGLGELSDLEYFRRNMVKGLKLPEAIPPWFAPAGIKRGIVNDLITKPISLGVSSRGNGEKDNWAEIYQQGLLRTINPPYTVEKFAAFAAAEKAEEIVIEKPTVDFSKISLLSPPTNNGLERHSAGMWSGVDLATVDVEQERIDNAAKEIRDRIDREILASITIAAAKDATSWHTPTFGWSEETTKWAPEAISWKTHASMLGYSVSPSEFGGVITTDATAPVSYNSDTGSLQQKVEFTEDDLDLIKPCESEVMIFA